MLQISNFQKSKIKKKVGKIDTAFIFHMANYDRFQPKVQCTFLTFYNEVRD